MSRRTQRKLHRILGLVLLLPCLVWVVTGILFHWKPGWSEAYAPISVKSYPINDRQLEQRRLRTVLGEHLLIRGEQGWQQWDETLDAPRAEPSDEDRRRLFEEALAQNAERFGTIESLDGWTVTTTTGVEVTLDWNSLRMRQSGRDTRFIDRLYKLHYLQWTGTKWGDRSLPIVGLLSLLVLALLGLRLAIRG